MHGGGREEPDKLQLVLGEISWSLWVKPWEMDKLVAGGAVLRVGVSLAKKEHTEKCTPARWRKMDGGEDLDCAQLESITGSLRLRGRWRLAWRVWWRRW